MFIVIEMLKLNVQSVFLFKKEENAQLQFEKCCAENRINDRHDWPMVGMYVEDEHRWVRLYPHEVTGTIRIAGDDIYAVQLIKVEPVD